MKHAWGKTLALGSAGVVMAGGLAVAGAAPSFAHTGDLSASPVCQDDGTYLITYKLQLKNVPSGQTGHVYYRVGTTTFDGTPTSNANMTKVGDFTGNPLVTLGTKTLPGTATQAPWAYAFTNWTPDAVKVGSDGGDIPLAGTCKPKITKDSSASVSVTDGTCDAPGHLVYGPINAATFSGTADGTQGPASYDVSATSIPNHSFPDGAKVKSFTGSIPGKDVSQHCFVQPPDNHRSHSTKPTCKHPVIVTTNEVQHYSWNGSAYVPGPWVVESIVKTHVDLTKKCARHAHVRVKSHDGCNCFRDWVKFFHGPNVRVTVTHPAHTVWIAHVTGKKVNGHQYLLPSKINGSHGWAVHQNYKVATTNKPCPCHKTHTCHHIRPGAPPHCPTTFGRLSKTPCTV